MLTQRLWLLVLLALVVVGYIILLREVGTWEAIVPPLVGLPIGLLLVVWRYNRR